MGQQNGRSTAQLDLLGGKFNYRALGVLAAFGTVFGLVVGSVLNTSPTAVTTVKYVAPACAFVGLVAGARYGYFVNIVNRCKGGQVVCGIIGGIGAAAAGTLALSLVFAIVGTLAGFAVGWVVGSFLTNKKRGAAPLFGTIMGVVAQACWMNPTAAMKAGALGSVIGAIGGLLFLVACVALGYVVLRSDPPGRN